MDAAARTLVRERAKHRCKYCLVPEALSYHTFHIEHVIPIKHRGSDDDSNLCLACRNCNLHKSSNLSGLDPDSGELTPLFNPRVDNWTEHFIFRGPYIDGTTPVGRATIYVLAMNDDDQVAIRDALRLYSAD